jgi:hypothetical protein
MKFFTVDILWDDGRASKYLCRALDTMQLMRRIEAIAEGRHNAGQPFNVFQINIALFQGEVHA